MKNTALFLVSFLILFSPMSVMAENKDWIEDSITYYDDAGNEGSWNKGVEVTFHYPNRPSQEYTYILICEPDQYTNRGALLYYKDTSGEEQMSLHDFELDGATSEADKTAVQFWNYYCK